MTTDTPRTDALMRPNGALATNLLEHARQLEMELNNRAAEIDMLKNKINALKKEMKPHIEPDPDEDQI